MPFRSKAQQRYMEANKGALAKKGVNVREWEQATDYSKLPERSATSEMLKPTKRK